MAGRPRVGGRAGGRGRGGVATLELQLAFEQAERAAAERALLDRRVRTWRPTSPHWSWSGTPCWLPLLTSSGAIRSQSHAPTAGDGDGDASHGDDGSRRAETRIGGDDSLYWRRVERRTGAVGFSWWRGPGWAGPCGRRLGS